VQPYPPPKTANLQALAGSGDVETISTAGGKCVVCVVGAEMARRAMALAEFHEESGDLGIWRSWEIQEKRFSEGILNF
jgi:hypothetical protein